MSGIDGAVNVGMEIWTWTNGAEPSREPVFPHTTGYCNDEVVLGAVDEIESLTTGLSRKIWQKLVILQSSQMM